MAIERCVLPTPHEEQSAVYGRILLDEPVGEAEGAELRAVPLRRAVIRE
jgi:hypothetical protein